ncbi:Sym1p [Sugiyamaella lignohabitans]|uniref:Protein SYM1 n=1 Tax=Sugiyamaella lignohabitans TaxID=796027 RepID=A0A167FXW3_9ASCO|nr:Sym1p [Sugiyamaella lignohabitans]ANB15842.1 Sym1p [Sugiyamaella lignohabitans]
MASFFRWYNHQLAVRPVLTNSLSATVLFGVGDIIAQTTSTEDHSPKRRTLENNETHSRSLLSTTGIDLRRTSRACIFGGLFFAPIVSKWWYPFLNGIKGQNSTVTTLKRVALDQMVFAPFISVPMYFTCIGILEGKNFEQLSASLHRNYLPTLMANWSVWPAFQYANFMFIPHEYRLLAVNLVSIAWNTFLSFTNNRSNEVIQPEIAN